jgi:parvulin-like peptidyl-prolyl isomerase
VLERELNIKVADEDIKKYYDENPAKFEQAEMVRASHILFATKDLNSGADLSEEKKAAKKKLAQDVLKRARGGEDFAKLVKEFSDDPGSKESGGEYTFARATADPRHAMVPEFETAAFALKTNEISDIVTTQFGFHIIKLNEKIPAKKLDFAKVSPDIKEYLKQQQLQNRQQDYQTFVDKLKKDDDVAILDEKLKPKDTPEPPPTTPETKPAVK